MKTIKLQSRHRASVPTKWAMRAMACLGVVISLFANPSSAQTISPRRLLEVVDFSAPVVSPNGAQVAFRVEQASVERNTYDTVWYVQDMGGGTPPRRLADGGVPLRDSAGGMMPAPVVWSPDERWIYYRALVDGRIDVWRAAVDGSGAEPLTQDPADVRDFWLSADGKTLKYSVGATREAVIEAEQAEYDSGIRIDESVPVGQPLFRSGNLEGRLATQRYDGVGFDREFLLADVADRWEAIDLVTGAKRELTQTERPPHPLTAADLAEGMSESWPLVSEPGGGRIALLTSVGDGEGLQRKPDVQLAMLPGRKARRPIPCRARACTNKVITSVQWRPDSDEVLFTVTDPLEGLGQSIFRWNVNTGAVHAVVDTHGLINGGRDYLSTCGVSRDVLACVTAEADRPPRLERIDLESGLRQVLFDPNAALAADIAETTPVRLLRWTDAHGHAFTGSYFPARNSGTTPPPLFITYYRCSGFLRGGMGDEWPLASLAGQGISALCINQPHARILDRVDMYDQALSAIEAAVELLASQGEIDRTRVGMGGLSFGSEVALWVAMESDLLSAVSVTSPAVSPDYYLISSLKGEGFTAGLERIWQLGAPDETPDRWRELSPVFNLDRMQEPILMQMPEQEYIHSLDYAIPLLRSHRADLYVFPNEPHQKFQPRHKLAAYERNLDWFRFWLQGIEATASEKKLQYEHWRQMRAVMRSGVNAAASHVDHPD